MLFYINFILFIFSMIMNADNSRKHIFQNKVYKQTLDNLDNYFNSSDSILYQHTNKFIIVYIINVTMIIYHSKYIRLIIYPSYTLTHLV